MRPLFMTLVLASALLSLSPFSRAQAASDYIVGGETVPQNSPVAQGTVALLIDSSALCTGSIIDHDLIVTAAHCLAENPSDVRIVFSNELTSQAMSTAREAERYSVHPNYRPNQTSPDQNDIALLEFRGGLPAGYAPDPILPDDGALETGEETLLAGFGISDAQAQTGAGVLRETTVSIANASFGQSEVLLEQNEGSGACHGDSGGPAFLASGGKLYLWGVTSRAYPLDAPDDCAHESVYTEIASQMDFIRQAIPVLRR